VETQATVLKPELGIKEVLKMMEMMIFIVKSWCFVSHE
jgi:hypothetical protein